MGVDTACMLQPVPASVGLCTSASTCTSTGLHLPTFSIDCAHCTHATKHRCTTTTMRAPAHVLSAFLQAVFEDDEFVHIVMENCSGGELCHAVGERHYSERTAASYMRAVLRTLAQCHAHHILHRDIKPGVCVCGGGGVCVCVCVGGVMHDIGADPLLHKCMTALQHMHFPWRHILHRAVKLAFYSSKRAGPSYSIFLKCTTTLQRVHLPWRRASCRQGRVLTSHTQAHAHTHTHTHTHTAGNFMLLSKDERAPLKAIDFGLALEYRDEDLPLTNLGLEGACCVCV